MNLNQTYRVINSIVLFISVDTKWEEVERQSSVSTYRKKHDVSFSWIGSPIMMTHFSYETSTFMKWKKETSFMLSKPEIQWYTKAIKDLLHNLCSFFSLSLSSFNFSCCFSPTIALSSFQPWLWTEKEA